MPDTVSNFAQIDGYRLHYIDEGRGEPVLFVHGIPEYAGMYGSIVSLLSGSYRCIVPDHLGFGQSDRAEGGVVTPEAHADRLIKLIDQLDLANIHLVVQDLGGPIGIGAFVQKPHLFKSLTVTNTWLWSLKDTPAANGLKLMDGWLGRWLYLGLGFSVKIMAKNGFARRQDYEKHYSAFMKYHRTREDRYATYQLMLSMLGSSAYFEQTLKRLKEIRIPGQLVWGMQDKFFKPAYYLVRWKKEFPAFKIEELPESGHFPHLEAPREMATAINAFIKAL